MTDQSPPVIRYETIDQVLHVVFDRPEAKNSLTPTTVRGMIIALEIVAMDDAVRAIVIESTGDDFCSGADIVAGNSGDERPRVGNIARRTAFQAHRLIEVITTIQIPVICVVRGWAAGLGCQLALAADFTVASETARFWEPFCDRGFTPDSGATWLLPRLVGVARAKDLLMLGREVTGAEAAEWGMIHQAVPDDQLDDVAGAFVADVASRATIAMGLTKHCINGSLNTGLVEAMEREVSALELSSRTKDFREGLASFKERRSPDYQGR